MAQGRAQLRVPFRGACPRVRGRPGQDQVRHRRGRGCLDLGRHATSLARTGLAATSSVSQAICFALRGDLAAAESWLATTDQRAQDALRRPDIPELTVLVRAILDCRVGRYPEAARRLDEAWARCEAVLVGATLRVLRVIRAFAVAADDPRNAGLVTLALGDTRPTYTGELDFLATSWPEMARFLDTHALATKHSREAA